MKVLSFKVPESLDRKLTAVVKRRRVKKSALELAADLAGCVKDAPADLSSNPRRLANFGK